MLSDIGQLTLPLIEALCLCMRQDLQRKQAKNELPFALFSDGEDEAHKRRFALLSDMQAALAADDQLSLHFQPRIDLALGQCIGAEALLRWTHPLMGVVPPAEFIPIIEQTGLARPLTEWVLDTALAHICQWEAEGRALTVSINISARNLDEDDFAERVLARVDAAGIRRDALELEVTEGVLIGNGQRALAQLDTLKAAGIRIAVDDFGTGYSSLAYLKHIPAHCVKIDRAFIKDLEATGPDIQLVTSMVAMLHGLGFRIVAEGIETAKTYEILRIIGCDEAQGYFMAKPLAPDAFLHWLNNAYEPLRAAG